MSERTVYGSGRLTSWWLRPLPPPPAVTYRVGFRRCTVAKSARSRGATDVRPVVAMGYRWQQVARLLCMRRCLSQRCSATTLQTTCRISLYSEKRDVLSGQQPVSEGCKAVLSWLAVPASEMCRFIFQLRIFYTVHICHLLYLDYNHCSYVKLKWLL